MTSMLYICLSFRESLTGCFESEGVYVLQKK